MKSKKAFTLIELLVVVLIIGILAAIAVPKYQLAVVKSQYSTLKNLTKSIADAAEIYYLANGKYPNKLEELDINMPSNKLNTSTSYSYDYDWGSCLISYIGLVYCTNTNNNMYYQINFRHKEDEAGNKYCGVLGTEINTNGAQYKVCQQETNTTQPYFEDTSYILWLYP